MGLAERVKGHRQRLKSKLKGWRMTTSPDLMLLKHQVSFSLNF